MKYIKKLLYIWIISIILFIPINAQTIKLVRTDVDSARSNFVTATYLFGVDVQVDDVYQCNGVEFELVFNSTDYIKYSEWQVGGFGENATTVVIPIIDTLAGQGRVYVLVISGDPIDKAYLDNPKVIHLDFAVSQKSPHGKSVTFSFANAHATVNQSQIGEVLSLTSEPTVYEIHGFVNVWPGDTDNNGMVDEEDMDLIALHLNHGAATKNKRSFKRPEASTLWTAQRVLAWDSSQVSYADCDGDGNVTAYDMLVIPLNFGLTHSANKQKISKTQSSILNYEPIVKPEAQYIPIYINYQEPFIASTTNLSWANFPDNVKVLGFNKGNLFNKKSSFIYSKIDNINKSALLVTGDFHKNNKVLNSGILFYMVVESNTQIPNPIISNLNAMSEFGYTFALNHTILSNVEENIAIQNGIKFSQSNDFFRIIFPKNLNKNFICKIFNSQGIPVKLTKNINSSYQKEFEINTEDLASGIYFATLFSENFVKSYPFIIIR